MKIYDGTQAPETKVPALSPSNLLNRSPDSPARESRSEQKPRRRRSRSDGIRLRKRSGPATPLLRWKCDDGGVSVSGDVAAEAEPIEVRKVRNGGEGLVSARKLGAGLWQLQRQEGHLSGNFARTPSDRLGFEPGDRPFFCNRHVGELCKGTSEDLLQTPHSVSSPKNGITYKVDTSFLYADSSMERATKWDHGCSKTSEGVNRFHNQMKSLGDHQIPTLSVISTLQAELEEARSHIKELETERQSSKKKFEHFLRKLAEEKASWRIREHKKIRAIIEDIKDELNIEKKSRKRMEIVNSKLVSELAEVKLSAKQFMRDYEKERKARELIEEVCDELAKEIGEEKTEVEDLKRESMKIREEVEEERKMLQMAEVWREERVQMKLIDAKLALENKYSQLNKLIADVEAFLRLRGVTVDMMETREAEMLRQAASSAKIQEIKQFHYEPPKSDDIFSIVKELQPVGPNDGEAESCLDYSPAGCSSKVHCMSPESNLFYKSRERRYANGFVLKRDAEEEGSGWETVSHVEDQDSSFSPEGSDLSINRERRERYMSESGTEWEGKTNWDTPKTEVSGISSRSKKASSISRIWRSSNRTTKSGDYKRVAAEGSHGKLSNGIVSNGGIVSPGQDSGEGGASPRNFIGRWSLSDSASPCKAQGTKGCTERAQGIQNSSLKAKLLEARMENQKIQLRQVLKQKI